MLTAVGYTLATQGGVNGMEVRLMISIRKLEKEKGREQ
jgi:hypothetical protein